MKVQPSDYFHKEIWIYKLFPFLGLCFFLIFFVQWGIWQSEPLITPQLTHTSCHTSSQNLMGKCILESSITQLCYPLKCLTQGKALQRIVQQNNRRGFPPKENSNKTELTHLNCVHYFMHTGCSELVWPKVYLNKDLNEHHE